MSSEKLRKKDSQTDQLQQGAHVWQFARVGGVNRVNLTSGADLLALDQLDQKLWAALSCPVDGLEIDTNTLQLIDANGDKRIRVPEVLSAVKWITSLIKNPDELLLSKDTLSLDAINNSTEEGKILLASAKQILKQLGKPEAKEIAVADTSDVTGIFTGTQFNGDGIITTISSEDEAIQLLITQIIETIGSTEDRSGEPGVSTEQIEEFYKACEAYANWYKISEEDAENTLPFGDDTAAAVEACEAIHAKVDDYFLRCRLAAYDPASNEILGLFTSQYEAFSNKELTESQEEIAALPIAKMSADKTLPLLEGINPAWQGAVSKFYSLVITQVFPKKKSITQEDWLSIIGKVDGYKNWQASKEGAQVESLSIDTVREILKQDKQNDLLELIKTDLSLEVEANNMLLVDKLTRFYRDIFKLLKNFVNFNDFYSLSEPAIFQAGTLYLDQRRCDLCIKVNDMPKHRSMAGISNIYLIYCDCVSREKGEEMTIVAALTDGDNDSLIEGRNAVFYDREGNDWDATIVKIVENPVSIKQAFWSPYKKFARFISEQIEKFASKKDQEMTDKATSKISSAGENITAEGAEAGAAPTPFDIGKFVGIFAALSLALGAIGTFLVAVVGGFFGLKWWQMPLAIVGIILAISLPSMVLAYLKLRKRNLAPVLDANGWAINARLTINIIFGSKLTQLASLPKNSKLNKRDPFKKKRNPWWYVLATVVVIAAAGIILWHTNLLPSWIKTKDVVVDEIELVEEADEVNAEDTAIIEEIDAETADADASE